MRTTPQVTNALVGMALACLGTGLSGCAALLVGGGAVGGYALLSRDSVWNEFDLPKERLYRESLAVIEETGLVTTADAARGIIEAKVEDANVTVTVTELTRRTVQLKVKARSPLMMPAIDVAQRTYNQIIERLYAQSSYERAEGGEVDDEGDSHRVGHRVRAWPRRV